MSFAKILYPFKIEVFVSQPLSRNIFPYDRFCQILGITIEVLGSVCLCERLVYNHDTVFAHFLSPQIFPGFF